MIVKFSDNNTATLKFTCPVCGKIHSLENVDGKKIQEYLNTKTVIQRIFPKMSSTDREKIITGMCEECQDKIFGE